ncbi:MAG: toll/interleukin-1 receptor domain-containing protein [Bryobacteraceae bacterium]
MTNGPNVFISYASDTKPRAEELSRALESQGVGAWVNFKSLRPGQKWKEELEHAIKVAQWVVILLGSEDRAASWQDAEWRAALAGTWSDQEKRLLPVLFGDLEPPPFLRNWVPLRVKPDTEAATWTQNVLDVVRNPQIKSAYRVTARSLAERRKRMAEINRAAERMRKAELRDRPPVPARVKSQ